jgi:hypothetical protein
VSRTEIIERERGWATPAGLAAFGAVVLGLAANFVLAGALSDIDNETGELLARDADAGSFTASVVLQAASWFLLAVPYAYLFLAAAARSERVNRVLIGLFAIAPILLAVGSVIAWQGYADVADQFVEEKPALEAEAEAAGEEQEDAAGGGDRGRAEEDAGPTEEETAPTDEEEESDLVEERADELIEDSSAVRTGLSITFGGLLGLSVGILYTCLQAMRVGLLTRFFGSLGMALAVAMILLQLLPGVLLFTIALGLLIIGRWPGGRPPAWEAGRAIPWPPPGEQPRGEDSVEGRGEEIEAAAGDEPAETPEGASSGPRRKRKRRR